MYDKIVLILLIVSLSYENVEGRKLKRIQQPKESDNPAPQPNVLTYSTFGFNDVGSHDGFIPTSPDNSNYLTKYKDTSEKLYAPAFPSAPDSDFTSNSQSLNGELTGGDEGAAATSMSQFNSVSNYGPSNFNSNINLNKNSASDVDYSENLEENNRPVYGSKISTTNKNKSSYWYNDTEPNNGISYQNEHKFSSYRESPLFSGHLPSYSEPDNNNQFTYNYATTYPTTEIENSMNAESLNTQNLSNFPNVGDFASTKSYDTFESENKHLLAASKPLDTYNSIVNSVGDDKLNYYEDHSNKLIKIPPSFKNTFENKGIENIISSNQNLNTNQGYLSKHSNVKNNFTNKKLNNDYKDEQKTNPWILENGNNYVNKRIKNHKNGYGYATNFSSTSFKFDENEPKKQFDSNIDEIIPSSSNINDFTNYKFPETDYFNFKANPIFKNTFSSDNSGELSYNIGSKYNPSADYLNKFKNVYSNVPTSSTNWGNIFKSTDYSSYKKHIPKAHFDIVHIPKRQNNYRHGKDSSESIAHDWPIYNNKPSILQRPKNEYSKQNFNDRFKSEEDLLGLRNHDTSHPTYLPSFQYPGTDNPDEIFKTAVEKWRENYIKSKYHDTPTYDYEASEAKHFPASNSYQIQVPHPVIVPVPQPYPVRVPVAKPVAVPVMREITVPIEKPVLYPVYKKVPYPIEKLVPVPVEKQVPVPVVKPYPVSVPQVRPVFHHSRPYRDEFDLDQDFDDGDEYLPRPESSKVVYSKRPKSPRNRSRRPSRMSHQERSKGKRPQRRPNGSREKDYHRYVQFPLTDYQRFRNHDDDFADEREHRDYLLYCKRIGNC